MLHFFVTRQEVHLYTVKEKRTGQKNLDVIVKLPRHRHLNVSTKNLRLQIFKKKKKKKKKKKRDE